jgi:hypothetical protein
MFCAWELEEMRVYWARARLRILDSSAMCIVGVFSELGGLSADHAMPCLYVVLVCCKRDRDAGTSALVQICIGK